MTNTTKRIATAIATGAVLLQALAPLTFADTTGVISTNGVGSQNTINVNNTNNTSVQQSNSSNVSNTVVSNANSGGNSANANTGGNTAINAGAASSTVNVVNSGNTNAATVSNCGCTNNVGVGIETNGAHSANAVNVDNSNTTSLGQSNDAYINNDIYSNATSGNNDANANTGGNTSITTHKASSDVNVGNAVNTNQATIGGGAGSGVGNGGDTVLVTGNGAHSDNTVTLDDNHSITLGQGNSAEISNTVFSDANSGGNDANANTGGNVTINAGKAEAGATIVNEPNFNFASIADCACASNGNLLKEAGNGAHSASAIYADLGGTTSLGQANDSSLDNYAIPTADSGSNDANANTGTVYGAIIDPVTVTSGDAMNNATVINNGNVNSFGPNAGMGLQLPGLGNVQFTTNFSSLWTAWMSFMSSSQV